MATTQNANKFFILPGIIQITSCVKKSLFYFIFETFSKLATFLRLNYFQYSATTPKSSLTETFGVSLAQIQTGINNQAEKFSKTSEANNPKKSSKKL
jgi:hypothetical protein